MLDSMSNVGFSPSRERRVQGGILRNGANSTNQYVSVLRKIPTPQSALAAGEKWCRHEESNPGPTDYKSVALPTELRRHNRILARPLRSPRGDSCRPLASVRMVGSLA